MNDNAPEWYVEQLNMVRAGLGTLTPAERERGQAYLARHMEEARKATASTMTDMRAADRQACRAGEPMPAWVERRIADVFQK